VIDNGEITRQSFMTARAAVIRSIVADLRAKCESVPKPRSDIEMRAISR
jgi:hypothetical protein